MNTEDKMESYQEIEKDNFLKSLFNEDCLMSPSLNFTSNLMQKINAKDIAVSSAATNAVGKKITFLIFGLIALINICLIFFLWPYVSVWLPEEGLFRYFLENLNTIISAYAIRIFLRTASFSLIFIIILASFSLFGIDNILKKRFRILQNSTFIF
jgi:hypothetical protein